MGRIRQTLVARCQFKTLGSLLLLVSPLLDAYAQLCCFSSPVAEG
jgi:hypothetical protein